MLFYLGSKSKKDYGSKCNYNKKGETTMYDLQRINLRNQVDLKKETNLYMVEAITRTTPSWRLLSEVSDPKKSIPLHFEELTGKKLYAKFVREGEKSYWKLFIIDNSTVNVLYVETGTLNPVGKYQP